jgi:hypothetical protein
VRALAIVAMLCATAAAAPPVASGPVKAYRGPEGEQIAIVEVNDGKQVLVLMRRIGGPLDGKAVLYQLEDHGRGEKSVFVVKKRASKTYRSHLLSAREHQWEFFHPTNPKVQFGLRYSQSDSEALHFEDVLKAYNP